MIILAKYILCQSELSKHQMLQASFLGDVKYVGIEALPAKDQDYAELR